MYETFIHYSKGFKSVPGKTCRHGGALRRSLRMHKESTAAVSASGSNHCQMKPVKN